MIEVSNLQKTFRDRKRHVVDALCGVTFACRRGEVFGLLGPNGAGKTTALRILSTTIRPSGGSGKVMGYDVVAQSREVRRSIGFLSTTTDLYGRLTPREVLTYFGRLYQMRKPQIEARIVELAEALEMNDFLDRICDRLSSGMRRRANIARTLFHSPPVMILDEPMKGLDVLASRAIVQLIRQSRRQQRTVLLSTHIMAEVEQLCDRIAVIHQGRLLFLGTLEELRNRHGSNLEEAFLTLVEKVS